MKPALHKLRIFVKHPVTQMVTGLILLVSGGAEVLYDFLAAERSFALGAHHGVALFGLMQMLGSLPEIVDGIDRSFNAVEVPPAPPNEGAAGLEQLQTEIAG
jgi:hypothetical protein